MGNIDSENQSARHKNAPVVFDALTIAGVAVLISIAAFAVFVVTLISNGGVAIGYALGTLSGLAVGMAVSVVICVPADER